MDILVYADWIGLNGPTLMGILSVVHTRGHGIFSFAYDKKWLEKGSAQELDPELRLYGGSQYLAAGKKNFGIFLDSSPDRWGRVLMARREAIQARMAGRKERTLFEEDYLLGVFDAHRMGALRFKLESNGPFLNNDDGFAAPPWTSMRELEHASLQLEKDALSDEESLKWLTLLIAPGASLGGARPKASVKDPEGNLWIAKFPSVRDEVNIGGWEMVVNVLAKNAGINIADGQVKKYNSKDYCFLSKRFDRTPDGSRIHFASAMTLLGRSDGEAGASYLDLAEFVMQQGSNADHDLEELWRRIVFYIAVKNTDDHLRNHGFMLGDRGWTLSPAFDINPVAHGAGLTLNISEKDNSLDFDLARSVAAYFRINAEKSALIISNVKSAVRNWQKTAKLLAIPKSEQDRMAQAFEMRGG
jgi:serine/threonine-protein kinase HipA